MKFGGPPKRGGGVLTPRTPPPWIRPCVKGSNSTLHAGTRRNLSLHTLDMNPGCYLYQLHWLEYSSEYVTKCADIQYASNQRAFLMIRLETDLFLIIAVYGSDLGPEE